MTSAASTPSTPSTEDIRETRLPNGLRIVTERLPAARIDLGLDILGDVLTDPAFRPNEVDAERHVIVEEILMNLDMPEDHVHTLLAEAVFPGHPLGREVLGTRETVEAASRDQIADFFAGWYLPRNLVVVAAGDLDHDRVVDGFAATLG